MARITDHDYDINIPSWVEEGVSRAEIAQRLGVKYSSLTVLCSRRGVCLRKGGVPPRKKSLTSLSLRDATLTKLRREAEQRGTTEVSLVSRMLEIIVADNLVEAVLDDVA